MLLITNTFYSFCFFHRKTRESCYRSGDFCSRISSKCKDVGDIPASQPLASARHQRGLELARAPRSCRKNACYTALKSASVGPKPYQGRQMPIRSSYRTLFLFILIIIASGFAGAVYAQHSSVGAANSDTEVRDNLRVFSEIYSVVEQNYAEPVSPDKAIYNGAIPGMLHVLDPHSN